MVSIISVDYVWKEILVKSRNNNLEVAIIGAGWYGCHIASSLLKHGHRPTIIDETGEFFSGASGVNQNRLHLGYHYPRCNATRAQSFKGFHLFKQEYPDLCAEIGDNVYAISKRQSELNYEQYINAVAGLGEIEATEKAGPFRLREIEGAIKCQEERIDHNRAKQYFIRSLGKCIHGETITQKALPVLKSQYDYVIDCSWGGVNGYRSPHYFEVCVFHLYAPVNKSDHFAITVMDGPFFSLYPYDTETFSLTNVDLIGAMVLENYSDAKNAMCKLRKDRGYISKHLSMCEERVRYFLPDFDKYFKYHSVKIGIKTKFISPNDSRYSFIEKEQNLIRCFSGKIDTIFEIEKKVMDIIR